MDCNGIRLRGMQMPAKAEERINMCFKLYRVQGSYLHPYGLFQRLAVSEIKDNMRNVAFPTSSL